ncbi:MAG: TfoX/Sxy family protein [Vicinamibacterales bacterium]
MSYDLDLAARVRRALAHRPDLVEKHMFGGICFMVRGHMCCGVTDDDLMVRLEPAEADALADEPHVRPMDFTGRPMRGFLFVDADGLSTPAALKAWVDRTVRCAHAKPIKRAGAPAKERQGRGRSRRAGV